MRSRLNDYGFDYNKIPLYCDSQSAIAFSCNTVQHPRTKHIAVRYHFIKEQVENEIVELYFVKTAYQLTNIFTKALARERFEFLVKSLGMQSITPEELKHLAESDEDKLRQPWRAIPSVLNRSLTGKETSWETARLLILQILWGIVYSANLDFASLIWDEFGWKIVDRSTKQTKMSKLSNSEMHSEVDDLHITKLSNTVKVKFKFRMEISDTMVDDAFNKTGGYKYYMAKKVESEKPNAAEEPEERNVPHVRSGRGKGYMRSSENEANVPKLFKINIVPRKTRYLTVVEETIAAELAKSVSIKEPRTQQHRRSQLTIDSQIDEDVANMYAEWGQKLKGPVVDDPTVQSLLDLRKGSKASRLESLKQNKQPVAEEGSSVVHTKYYCYNLNFYVISTIYFILLRVYF
ncbi:hypothetical protein Tco_0127988 [Tanacetum coccineum]